MILPKVPRESSHARALGSRISDFQCEIMDSQRSSQTMYMKRSVPIGSGIAISKGVHQVSDSVQLLFDLDLDVV